MTFYFGGEAMHLFDHPYNSTARNERAVEVPIATVFRASVRGRGLEVGNVLSHYGFRGHEVVDLYERAPGVQNIDIFDVEGSWQWIISISTVEHIGWPNDPTLSAAAIQHMRSLLVAGGSMFLTAGLGQHTVLDDVIYRRDLGPTWDAFYVRELSPRPTWTEVSRWGNPWRPYDWHTPSARTVWLARWDT